MVCAVAPNGRPECNVLPSAARIPSAQLGAVAPIGATGTLDEPDIANAKAFRRFLTNVNVEMIICSALRRLYDDSANQNNCEGRMTNSARTVSYLVTTTDSVAETLEIELLGKSSELALKSANWVERHRFYVSIGFNANLEPQIIVVDFEPMLRTTSELLPERNDLFEHIALEHDSEIRVLQESIKSSISAAIQAANRTFVEAKR
jgi:hypothetical protein